MSSKTEGPIDPSSDQAPNAIPGAIPDAMLDAILEQHFLAEEVHINPSSGFLQNVMSAVAAQAATPRRIPFPWARAGAGVASVLVVLAAWMSYLAAHATSATPSSSMHVSFAWTPVNLALACAGAAVLLSLGTLAATLRAIGPTT